MAVTLQVSAMPLNLKRPRLHTCMGTFFAGKGCPDANASFTPGWLYASHLQQQRFADRPCQHLSNAL